MKANVKAIHTHAFCFNPEVNGGESITFTTQFVPNDHKDDIDLYQKITLMSGGNEASIHVSHITPNKLRQLASEIEEAQVVAKIASLSR